MVGALKKLSEWPHMAEKRLTGLQAEILAELLRGMTQHEIAAARGKSRQAVFASVRSIRKKLNCKTDVEIGAWGERNKCMPGQG